MSELIKKPVQTVEWDPFRVMREMMSPDWPAFERATYWPNFEVTENKESFVFKADLPGVKQEDLEITTTGNRLQIFGKRDSEIEKKDEKVYTYERQYGSFTRTFTLPEGLDLQHAKSALEKGVLTLVIPKLPELQAKKIPITIGPKS